MRLTTTKQPPLASSENKFGSVAYCAASSSGVLRLSFFRPETWTRKFLSFYEAAGSCSSLPCHSSITSRDECDAARFVNGRKETKRHNVGHYVERGVGVGRVKNVRLVGLVVTAGRLRGVLPLCVLRPAEQGRGALHVKALRPTDHG